MRQEAEHRMNGEADALVHQLGEQFLEEAKLLEPGWSTFYGRFQYFEGAKKKTYWFRSAAGERGFVFPRLDNEITDLVDRLRGEMAAHDRPWLVCLARLGPDRDFHIDFEYEDDDRWNPSRRSTAGPR